MKKATVLEAWLDRPFRDPDAIFYERGREVGLARSALAVAIADVAKRRRWFAPWSGGWTAAAIRERQQAIQWGDYDEKAIELLQRVCAEDPELAAEIRIDQFVASG